MRTPGGGFHRLRKLTGLSCLVIPLGVLVSQTPASPADIFFLDLGIVIEPTTGKESYSRLVEAPSQEVEFRIKKVHSGSVYLATSREVLAALERINTRIANLEDSFQAEMASLRQDNQDLRVAVADLTQPPAPPPPERPTVHVSLEEAPALADLATLEKLPVVTVPSRKVATRPFSQTVYMSAVFAYQREDYDTALGYFSQLVLEEAPARTAENVLYWMADSYQLRGDYQSALALLDSLLNFSGSRRGDDALIKKGLVHRKLGQEVQALAAFQEVVKQFPDSEYQRLARLELKKAEMLP